MVLRPKIELAHDLIENRFIYRADAYSFQTLYPFCNENVSGYLDFLDLKDKSLLTVGSFLNLTSVFLITTISIANICIEKTKNNVTKKTK